MSEDNRNDAFEVLVARTLAHDASPLHTHCRHSMETFVLSLAGELAPEQDERLRAHLLICPRCARRYDSLSHRVCREQDELAQSNRWPPLVSYMRKTGRGARRIKRALAWLAGQSGFKRIAIGGGVASAIICVLLISSLALHNTPAHGAFKSSGDMVAKGSPLAVANVPAASVLTPKSLVARLDAMGGYDMWRAAAFIIGYLRAAGVPLESVSLAFEQQTIYVTGEDDTWETVSQKVLGDKDLWPIIILLNRDRTVNGEFPPVGTLLRVPAPAE